MDTRNKSKTAAVDDILEELKGKRPAAAQGASGLDDILAELGMAKDAPLPKRPVAPAPAKAPAQKAQPRPAAPARPKAEPVPVAAAPESRPAPEKRPEPAPRQEEDLFAANKPGAKKDIGGTTILDIAPVQTTRIERVGKAAALDKVDHDKYSGDTELLSWFSGGEQAEPALSKREQKRMEKERKKQEAADRKRPKTTRARAREQEDELPPLPQLDVEAARKATTARPEVADTQGFEAGMARQKPAPVRETVQKSAAPEDTQGFAAAMGRASVDAPKAVQAPAQRPEAKEKRNEREPVAPVHSEEPAAYAVKGKVRRPIVVEAEEEAPRATVRPASASKAFKLSELEAIRTGAAARKQEAVQRPAAPAEPAARQAPAAPKAPVAPEAAAAATVAGAAVAGTAQRVAGVQRQDVVKPKAPAPEKPAAPVARQDVPEARPVAPVQEPPVAKTADASSTQVFTAPPKAPAVKAIPAEMPEAPKVKSAAKLEDTKAYELPVDKDEEPERVPTAAFTQEFDSEEVEKAGNGEKVDESKSLFVDDMVDDRFRAFFGETVIVDKEDLEGTRKIRRGKKSRTKSLFTGEFAQLAQQAELEGEGEPEEDENDYNRPQDAETVEKGLVKLQKALTGRLIGTGAIGLLLFWLGFAYVGLMPIPGFIEPVAHPMAFGVTYLILVIAMIAVNFTTVAAGLVGLVGEPTVDSAPALACVGALLQGVVVLAQMIGAVVGSVTLFGGLAALIVCCNSFGKRMKAGTILRNFQLASAGGEHSAAYIVDGTKQDLARHVTDGLEEDDPVLLVSRPTALVKGFMRQSFSLRWSDGIGRILGWALVGVALVVAVISYIVEPDMLLAISSFAAAICIGAPFSSTLVSAIPSAICQQSTSKVGAVVPGWSAIQELGDVNVVMAGGRDVFPPTSVQLKGIKTYQKERIDVAILYAASVLIEGCDTMRDIFLGVIQGKSDMLYKVESLTKEPGRGFTAWVENHRVVIGNREMLKKHDIEPPSIEAELEYTKAGCQPVYLAVSGKLFAMFVMKYDADLEVEGTLQSLVRSGVSLLITSDDMNITPELVEEAYGLPQGVVKVLGRRELDMLEPMTSYIPESEGVMTHIGTFTSFIGGMSAAANCAASERMSVIVQIASVVVAALLSIVLVTSGSLATLGISIALLFQLGWTVLIGVLPLAKRF